MTERFTAWLCQYHSSQVSILFYLKKYILFNHIDPVEVSDLFFKADVAKMAA